MSFILDSLKKSELERQRLDGLDAAEVRAGQDPLRGEILQGAGQGGCLAAPLLGQRPKSIVAVPVPPGTGVGMSDQQDRHGP